MKRRHRTIIARVIVFLLLGAIVNVAVAWGWLGFFRMYCPYGEEMCQSWAWREIDAPEDAWEAGGGYKVGLLRFEVICGGKKTLDSRFAYLRALGVDYSAERGASCSSALFVGMPLKTVMSKTTQTTIHERTFYPLEQEWRPIWPGLAINTIFYAGVLWMLFAIGGFPFAMRRRRRLKRGLCPACAYPVGGSPVCTECGGSVKAKSVELP